MRKRKSSILLPLICGAILGIFLTGCIEPGPTMVAPSMTATTPAKQTVAATLVSMVTPVATASATATPTLEGRMPTANNIPTAFHCYLNGVAAKDLDATVACFADDALVIDVGRRIEGKGAIRRWLGNEVMGLKYEVETETLKQDGAVVIVRISFGSGGSFRARYDMDFKDARIIKMDLQYA